MRCTRRSWLALPAAAGLAAVVGSGIGGCAQVPTSLPPAPPLAAPGVPQAVAPGVWEVRGHPGEIDTDNGGRIGNAGFIVGDHGVLVIDSGGARRHGEALLAAVRSVTPLPVRGLLLTHARQEFVFGACAFRDAGVPVLMSRRCAMLMASRCEGCLKTLKRVLGDELMQGTELVKPDVLIDEPSALPAQIADAIGRDIRLLAFGHSSGPGDLAVLESRTGWLFAGGLADAQRVPDLQDADLPGWHRALEALRALPLAGVLPGHGPAAPPAALAEVQAYLRALDARTLALAREGVALSEVPDRCDLPDYAAWDQFDTIHRRNASILFLRHERQMLHG